MAQVMTADEKYRMMTQKPVEQLIWTLAIPTIISMLITSIYNMADTFFVSRISTSASGAVGISFSLMTVIQALGFTFGTGSGNYISRLLGREDTSYASKVAATGFFTGLGLGILLAVLGLIFLDPLVYALGATDTIAPYAKSYLGYILIGMPYMVSAFVLNNILRFQGSAFWGMLGISTGALLNIVLDPIFIFGLHMGIGGAALATIISQFISFCILWHNCGIGGNIKIRLQDFTPKWEIYKKIISGGMPSFCRQALAGSAMVALNFSAGVFGDAAIAAMSIVTRLFQVALSAIHGFGQGFQPVCGYNYGAKHYDRVLKAFWFSLKITVVVLVVLCSVGFVFSSGIMALFRKEDLTVVAIGSRTLRLQCIFFPLSAWVLLVNMLLQTIGKGAKASLVSISRQGLFFLPAILLLPHRFGLLGVQISQPVADIFSFLLALVMGISILKELKVKLSFKGDGSFVS